MATHSPNFHTMLREDFTPRQIQCESATPNDESLVAPRLNPTTRQGQCWTPIYYRRIDIEKPNAEMIPSILEEREHNLIPPLNRMI
ncbi:uncharacterized protein TNCV_4390691 [Trichonephila clavipes]|nr:uncharacterized protein TNCV_4390691 [Trichonephila clavipes]